MGKRAVITGIGALTPIGCGKEGFFAGLRAARNGIGRITRFDPAPFGSQMAGEIRDFEPADYMDKKESRRMDRFCQLGVAAARLAVADGQLKLEEEDPCRVGLSIGSGIGGIETFTEQVLVLDKKGPGRVSPFFIPMMIPNMAAGQISIFLGIKGPSLTTVSACASSADAIGHALRLIQRGEVDVVVAGGTEAPITPVSLAGFGSMKALSTRNDDPEHACRPFDRDRDGFVMGEGAGVVLVEELEHARARGAHIYAELCGYGASSDAYHITAPAPGGEGAARAMALALADAGVTPVEVDYVNAHGTSTGYNDLYETQAIKSVFGEQAHRVAVSSTKSMTGHLLGAAGAVELIACLFALEEGIIPPTINYTTPDPDCDLDYVPNTPREAQVRTALSNSFGFGGHNAALVVRRLDRE
ncbi:beta-ketoacyl-ACP synthase II [Gelria sp. Kuro-4]|uniref:beta-ketoacyl-ACP synthase II n=1 Tax=Gelria sp. Kuro-4 TaxID=2796927 RepID=UPI001BEF2DB4|nr:beta-ketoacyl-ACP synthase II [Gelria sp. Kuro-4]MDI3521948.1 3-oxoacyl-[acyl-carrier-protein] synthase [Bacillota bacterium]BCV24789.1 3-oxoacyl-[acyl-carrier-protein] synthase 2 [Gelria sp. Kuro-4]